MKIITLFLGLLLLLSSATAVADIKDDNYAKNFCIVPIPIIGKQEDKSWLRVTDVTTLENSPFALIFSNFSVRRFNGYQLVEIPAEELPYNSLNSHDFQYDSVGNVYAKGIGFRGIGYRQPHIFLIMDSKTGLFRDLTKKEKAAISETLLTDYTPKEIRLHSPDREIFSKDYKHFIAFKNGVTQELEPIYGPDYGWRVVNTAHGIYVPFLNEYLVYGAKENEGIFHYIHKIFSDLRRSLFLSLQEPILYRLDGNKFEPVKESEGLKPYIHDKTPYLTTVPSHKIAILSIGNDIYYYGGAHEFHKLVSVDKSDIGKYSFFYDLPGINKAVMRSSEGLFEINEKNELVKIPLPQGLIGAKFDHIVDMPKSSVAIVFSDKGVYTFNAQGDLKKIKDDDKKIKGWIAPITTRLIPVRNEVFVHANEEFMIVDKRLSKDAPCVAP